MNPLQIMQIIKNGNPQTFIRQMSNNPQIANNPVAKNALAMMANGDSNGLRQMAENLCKENDTTPERVKQRIMSQFGIR